MVAVALAGATAVRELVGDDDGGAGRDGGAAATVTREGSTRIASERAFTHGAGPSTWRIRYRLASPGVEVTEDVAVRAPFRSHTDVRTDGDHTERRETALGVSVTKPAAGSHLALAPAPEVAGFRPGPVLEAAVDHRLVERREQRRVAGRPCQVYRTSATFGGTTFAPAEARDYVDLCVDGDGLLLELAEFSGGRLIRQRVALRVQTGVEVTDEELNELPHGQTIAVQDGGGSIRRVDPASRPVGEFLDLPAPPEGFTHEGRFEVIPPQPDIARPETRGRVVAATSDVFVAGPDAIVVERGARLDRSDPWERDERFPQVDLGPVVGQGEFLAGVTGGEVRAVLGDGRFVRVYGTVSLDRLVATARALEATSAGAGPVYLDD